MISLSNKNNDRETFKTKMIKDHESKLEHINNKIHRAQKCASFVKIFKVVQSACKFGVSHDESDIPTKEGPFISTYT